jgi:hypothetical protein
MRGNASASFFDLFTELPGTGHIFEHTATKFSLQDYPDVR